jgi:hypothetical protein
MHFDSLSTHRFAQFSSVLVFFINFINFINFISFYLFTRPRFILTTALPAPTLRR